MRNYIISKEIAEEYNIPTSKLEPVFSYTTFNDMRFKLEELGYSSPTDKDLQNYSQFLQIKFEDDQLERMISYLNYRGEL